MKPADSETSSVAPLVESCCPPSPRLTFGEVARRWIGEFEAKVAAGERRERTLEHYRGALERHILPRLATAGCS